MIAIDDDIDPNNADAILWAMTFRAKPHLDMQILPYREEGHGPRDKVRGAEIPRSWSTRPCARITRRSRSPSASTWSARA